MLPPGGWHALGTPQGVADAPCASDRDKRGSSSLSRLSLHPSAFILIYAKLPGVPVLWRPVISPTTVCERVNTIHADTGELFRRPARLNIQTLVNKPDHELIADCLGGQTQAFGELVLRYQDRLCNGLSNVMGSTEDAHDVAQDAFAQAFEKLAGFRGQSSFYSWLFRIALNASVTRHRRLKRVPMSIDAVRANVGQEPADPHPHNRPDYSLDLSERQQLVRAALAELSEEFRLVLVLKEIDGLKYEEIAEIVECPIGTVRSRIHRARLELREKLSHLWL